MTIKLKNYYSEAVNILLYSILPKSLKSDATPNSAECSKLLNLVQANVSFQYK